MFSSAKGAARSAGDFARYCANVVWSDLVEGLGANGREEAIAIPPPFTKGKYTNAMPGKLLRHGRAE